jgi:hypothetical protein
MADVQNVITLGIGSLPGNIRYFILTGLDVNPTVAPVVYATGPTPHGAFSDLPVVQAAEVITGPVPHMAETITGPVPHEIEEL